MRHLPYIASLVALAAASACGDPESFLPPDVPGSQPQGVLEGTVTYSGPLPCTESNHVVGAAVLLIFDVNLLPPPDGLGTSAASLAVVAGDKLFAGVSDRLTFNANGDRWCPTGKTNVTVSDTWAAAPLAGGEYEVRGFYDLDGNFDPTFLIANEPTKGDIGGGAIDNAADVLEGKAPIYRKIALGVADSKGTRVIPKDGARIDGIAVTLALPLPLERPVFHVASVLDPAHKSPDLLDVTMASDFQIETFSPAQPTETQASFVQLELGAGVAASEVADAVNSPFFLPGSGATLTYSRQDVNGDGKIDSNDHVPESTLLPALFPLAIFAKLAENETIVNQSGPTVVIEGLTLYKSLIQTIVPPTFTATETEALVLLRPSALCIDTTQPSKHAVLVVTHPTDKQTPGNPLISDVPGVEAALGKQFGRPVDLVYGCLPEGKYAMNLVYGTGQTWSVPNEAGECAASEMPATATKCGVRPRLASQSALVTIGPPSDPSYCKDHPVPAACQPD